MGVPKRKQPEKHEPTEAEREAAEDRADAEAYRRAKAEAAACGEPPIPWEEAKKRLGLK